MTTAASQDLRHVTDKDLDQWAMDETGPVALHLKQRLLPVEAGNGEGGIIFPPTYADIGYNIDELSDGTRVATIDSVGSQANRLEPIFKTTSQKREDWLVPQIDIVLQEEPCGECEGCKAGAGDRKKGKATGCTNPQVMKRSIFDLAHRAADAVVQSSPGLNERVENAFKSLQNGDAHPLCALAPTSLVFGVWDSRGGTGEKRPRLVRSIIRAWNVDALHAAAQFNSVWKALGEHEKAELNKEARKQKVKLSVKGFADAPSVFRDTKAPQYREGALNSDARVLGGVVAKGPIERDVTVNLIALRGLRGRDDNQSAAIRKYLLGLALMAATTEIELFLREGCHLRYSDDDVWHAVVRRGNPEKVQFPDASVLKRYVTKAAEPFRSAWTFDMEYRFDLGEAKRLLAKKVEEEEGPAGAT